MANYKKYSVRPYIPGQKEVYKVSRTKIELFTQCPRCFWLDARMKIKRPSGPPFQINKAIDELLKKEFDIYRKQGKPHPIMKENQIKAVPMKHKDLDKWRHNFTGVNYLHKPTNLYVFGAVDDVWISDKDEVIVVDYKATAKKTEVDLTSDWQIMYKRQMEIYQWLIAKNGFKVSNTGYFVYANGRMDLDRFDNKVEFVTKLIPYTGNYEWVDDTLLMMKKCLDGTIPKVGTAAMGGVCEHCDYAKKRTKMTIDALQKNNK